MGRKRGQRNKKTTNEKEKDEAENEPKASSIPCFEDTTVQSSSEENVTRKQKRKKGKDSQTALPEPEKSTSISPEPCSSSTTSFPLLESAQTKKKGKKKQQQAVEKKETAPTKSLNESHSSTSDSFSKVTIEDNDDDSMAKKSPNRKKLKQREKHETEDGSNEKLTTEQDRRSEVEEVLPENERERTEFETQQNRKKRKQKKSQVTVTIEQSPIQRDQQSSTSKRGTKQTQQIDTRPNLGETKNLTRSCEFPTLEAKPFQKIVQKHRQSIQQNPTVKEQGDFAEEFKKLHISSETAVSCPNKVEAFYELAIPDRKRTGTKGRPIVIETNHLALTFGKMGRAVHYDVSITPNTPKKLFRKIMEEFRQIHYITRYPAFDGTKNLYSFEQLPFEQQVSGDITIMENERPKSYRVVIKFANFVDLSPLEKFMKGCPDGIQHILTPQEVIQCLDIVLRSAPALTCLPVGRSYFTPPRNQILSLGGGMEMYYGFYQSAIIGWKPFLNIDVAHKAFPTSQNVIDLIAELCELKRDQLQRYLHKNEEETVSRFLRTLKVRYEIPGKPATRREFRVNNLDQAANYATFKIENGPEMTVEKYFRKEKDITLKYPCMPCLWVGSKERRILLPAEFCTVVQGQVINRKMSEKLTSAMIKQAATSTKVRRDKIMQSVLRARFNDDPCVREFGIKVNEEFTKIGARVLEPPTLVYNGRSIIKPNQGAWRPDKFLNGAIISQWTVVVLDRVRVEIIEEMVQLICSQASNLGMNIAQPQRPFHIFQPCYKKEIQDLEELFSKKKHLQMLIVVVPNSGPFYSYVKQAAELIVGCLTQCIRSRTVFKINVSTVVNILQKVNAKLEGINHILNDRLEWMKRPYMIMGADVTHPSPDAKDKPSVAAVTASYDPGAFKYNICWRLQPPKVEIIEDLENITREQLQYFYKSTKYKPERIVFFRDGVSEGQFSYVLNTEIQAIRRACTCLQMDGTYKPKITFLVVQKRHHTRFFPINPQDASKDKNLNVPVGTCVDTMITHPSASDFCLISHASIQGVARPTKYRILWDDADMNLDELEQLAFYFCHMFSRCTRSVSYPAPTYYAHLAAARIMTYCETSKLNMNNLQQEQERLSIKECIIKNRPMFFV